MAKREPPASRIEERQIELEVMKPRQPVHEPGVHADRSRDRRKLDAADDEDKRGSGHAQRTRPAPAEERHEKADQNTQSQRRRRRGPHERRLIMISVAEELAGKDLARRIAYDRQP